MGCFPGARTRSKGERREDDMSIASSNLSFFFRFFFPMK